MNARKPTEVCITVDTEFSIGRFGYPEFSAVAEPLVLGTIDGKEHGLGFLLDSFAEFDVRATFFVEALQTIYFGDERMGVIAKRIAGAGHDVQLHLHPGWLYFEGGAEQEPKARPDDSCTDRTDAELDHLFRSGLAAFERWGLARPIAVRTGNFQVDGNFYRAAARSGIALSSSIALAAYRPAEQQLALASGRHRIEQVIELPVFSYTWPLGRRDQLRLLAITACSYPEMASVLWRARAHGISPLIILTHPQEYIKRKDFRYKTLRPNRVNQTRLRSLLQFLNRNREDFVTLPLTEIDPNGPEATDYDNPMIAIPFRTALPRMIENRINDLVWWY